MPKFVNRSGVPLDVFRPAGDDGSVPVQPDQVLEVAGELEEVGDAYVVTRQGEEPRAYSKALWDLQEDKKTNKSSRPADSGEVKE